MPLIHSNASGHLTVRFKISAIMRNDNKSSLTSSALTTHKSEACAVLMTLVCTAAHLWEETGCSLHSRQKYPAIMMLRYSFPQARAEFKAMKLS